MPVPVSGRATAVGMTIESAFGQAPLTLASGSNYNVGIAGSNPERFFKLNPCRGFPVKPEMQVGQSEIDGDFDIHRIFMTARSYQGEFAWPADPENLYYPFLGIFGVDAQTGLDTSQSPNSYGHAFQPNKKRGYQPSFTIEEVFGGRSYGRITTGCVVQKLELTFGRTVTAQKMVLGAHQAPNNYLNASSARTNYDYGSAQNIIPSQLAGATLGNGTNTWTVTPSPTYIDVAEPQDYNGPLIFAQMGYGSQGGAFAGALLTVDGAAYGIQLLEGFTISIERKIEALLTALTDYDMATFVGDEWIISGKMNLLFTDNTIPLAVLRRATCGLNLKITGPAINAVSNYALEAYIPNFNFQEGGVEIPDTHMIVGGTWTAKQDPAQGYSGLFTLTNTVTNAGFGGGGGSQGSAGGLGGFSTSAV